MAKRGDLDVPVMDYEFFVDADITVLDLLTTHNHERQHQLSQTMGIAGLA
jgi:hypothetical protein